MKTLNLCVGIVWLLGSYTAVAAVADRFDYPIGNRGAYTKANDGDGWYVAQDFGEWNSSFSKYHLGEDWNAESGGNTDCGSPVYAVANGTIVYASIAAGWGRVLIVRHTLPDGSQVESLYGHLASFAKTSGDVARGDQVGTIGDGSEGGTTYPCHLHLEIRTAVCPSWGGPGPGYSTTAKPVGWTDPSDFIDAHRQTVVININSRVSGDPTRHSGTPVTRLFQAGGYSCTIISPEDFPAAVYSDWSAWGDARRLTAYTITTIDGTPVGAGGGLGSFTTTTNRTILFMLTNDVVLLFGIPDTNLTDNDGGVSLFIAPLTSTPTIFSNPTNRTVSAWTSTSFAVQVIGIYPLSYQWCFNGQNIPAATNATLTLTNAQASDSGGYSVVVWNAYGSAFSDTAHLSVLADGANGKQPVRVTVPTIPPRPSAKDSLVVITHGWEPLQPHADLSWMSAMSNAIQSRLPDNWTITNYVWLQDAIYANPELVLAAAEIHGRVYGRQLATQGWSHVHFIAHSAGCGLIENAAAEIPFSTTVQCTFLDPYVGLAHELQSQYGASAQWADCYFTQDLSGGWTAGRLPHAYNVDVDWLDPEHDTFLYGSSLIAVSTQVGISSHGYPHEFYTRTATNQDAQWCAAGHGFALSAEVGGEAQWINHPATNADCPLVLCGPANAMPSPTLPMAIIGITVEQVSHAVSDSATVIVNGAGFVLSSLFSIPQAQMKSGALHPLGGPVSQSAEDSTNAPAWLALGVPVTNAVNFVQFDAGFTDTNAAQGLLTVYWNTNQVGMVDERAATANLRTYRFSLPSTVTNGIYTLSFRLDSFADSSSITVTNVATGFAGITQPISLAVLASAGNTSPMLQLSAPAGYSYLVQSSSNLVNWAPAALVVNTNGMVLLPAPGMMNGGQQFYRAVLP